MYTEQIIGLFHEALAFTDPELSGKLKTVDPDAKLSEIGIDSISMLEIAAYIEEKLDVQFPDSELGLLADVRGFINLIQKHVGHMAPQGQK